MSEQRWPVILRHNALLIDQMLSPLRLDGPNAILGTQNVISRPEWSLPFSNVQNIARCETFSGNIDAHCAELLDFDSTSILAQNSVLS